MSLEPEVKTEGKDLQNEAGLGQVKDGSRTTLADADELMKVFQKKLRAVVNMDHTANTTFNDLKLMNDEFQFLATTNGIYLDRKFTDKLRTQVDKMNPSTDIYDKIFKRQKQAREEAGALDHLKSTVLDYMVDVQTEREYILQNLNESNSSSKLSPDENPYVAPLRVNYIDPIKNLAFNGFNAKATQEPNRPQRRSRRTSSVKTNENQSTASKPNTRGSKGKSKKNSLATTAITNNVVKSKRKRKPTVRADEILDDEEFETELTAILENQQEEEEPKKKRRRGKNTVSTEDAVSHTENVKPPEPVIEESLSQKQLKSLERHYDNTYISIWKDLARKDGPKAYRLFQQTAQAKSINMRKTAQLAMRECKKWQSKTTKQQKDLNAKARRNMREMLSFWKKNEKEERNLRLKAEQEALAKAKKEEEEREAKRQARKLNFLINQTELYSHFIGRKIKTSEMEGEMGDKNIPSSSSTNSNGKHLSEDQVDLSLATKDFNALNFDEEDEAELQKRAAANAQSALLEAKNKAQQFNHGVKRADNNSDDSADESDEEDNEGELNFKNPSSAGDLVVDQPKLLNCTLKEYQRKGLNWLANLYEQGINGILADEMGLGKTVQSISVLAYLAETHDIWGPFLVVTPSSTLHNWQQEITKFVPDFNVLPYWGTAKDRKVLRKFWDRKNIIYNRNTPFHVVVTSYQLVVADQQYFQKMKWQYMILDEAQAIKSSQSTRWKSLLNLQCRNRLLLTGTPIQNNMQELWALLHFIMPSLFDSHDEFSEWFSKDIEAHAQANSKLNEEQLRRLHAILKPFMLRRIKKNVQSELGDKIEVDVYCDLTNRQKKLYRMLRSQINLMDLIENNKRIGNNEEVESLMNVVMQFRKVCNHPDLFERADTKSAFSFSSYSMTGNLLKEVNEPLLELNYSTRNLIEYRIPKLIIDDLLLPSFEKENLTDKERMIKKMFSVYNAESLVSNEKNEMNVLKFVRESPSEVKRIVNNNVLINAVNNRNYGQTTRDSRAKLIEEIYGHDEKNSVVLSSQVSDKIPNHMRNAIDSVSKAMYMRSFQKGYHDNARAPPVELVISKSNLNSIKNDVLFSPTIRQALLPLNLDTQAALIENEVPLKDWPKAEMLPEEESNYMGGGTIRLPSMERFVLESAKLKKLDQMLVDLKKGGHKCLIYFQMTRMMDLMEEYLTYRQYKYIRLDGSSRLSDRRDLVNDWQTNPELFIFLLSTRAGGLGINLTAADTVIFYDSDWNPTIDSQAMDRAHRLGQTRQVTVYRLLVRGTIEERMRDRAKQKEHVQQVVMEGKVDVLEQPEEREKSDKKEMALWLLEDDK